MCVDAIALIPGSRRLRPEIGSQLPPLWDLSKIERSDRLQEKYVFGGKDEQLVAFTNGQDITFVRTNLARITRGGHGGVLKSQDDIEEAFRKLNAILDEISVCEGPALWKLSSIELGWNLGQAFRDLETLAMGSRTEWVRKRPVHIAGEKVLFKGAVFEAKFYNKALIMYRCGELAYPNLPISRIEVTLRGYKLKEVSGAASFVPEPFLSFANFRRWFRTSILSFENVAPLPTSEPISVTDRLLYVAIAQGWAGAKIGGMTPLEFVLQRASAATRRNWERKSRKMGVSFFHKNLVDLFPEGDWDEPVECGDLLVPRLESAGVPFRMRPDLVQDLSTPDDNEACASW